MCSATAYAVGTNSSLLCCNFFFSSRRRHTRFDCDWSSDVCSSDLYGRARMMERCAWGGSSGCGGRIVDGSLAAPPTDDPRARQTHTQDARGLRDGRSEEHTSELQSQSHLVCRLLLETKNRQHDLEC